MIIQKIWVFSLGIALAVIVLLPAALNAQNLFVSDYDGYKGVYEITPAGNQINTVSNMTDPQGLTIDRAGDLFVSDAGSGNMSSGSIVEITPAGVVNTFASGLNSPYGLAFDNSGDLFEADYGSNQVLEFTNQNGTLNPGPGVFASNLNGPVGLAFNRSGDLFEADFNSGNICEFTNQNGILVSNLNIFVSGLTNAGGLAFNTSNVLFVANDSPILGNSGSIIEVMPNGSTNTFASGLNRPLGLAFDTAGNLYVANQSAHNIVKITPNGTQSIYFAGSTANNPSGVAFAPKARLQARAANKAIQVTVSSPSPYYPTVVEVSSNFTNWTAICTNIPPFVITNSTTGMPRQYFRARCP